MSTALYWTLADFDRLVETGFFETGDKRVELVRGEIRPMSPIGSDHSEVVSRLNQWSSKICPSIGHLTRIQDPIKLPSIDCMLQPDVALVEDKSYRNAHPVASDVSLLIEVASSSLNFDLGEKRDIYASAGIPEYWVVDLVAEKLHLFRRPTTSGFEETQVLSKEDTATPLCAPAARLDISNLFN